MGAANLRILSRTYRNMFSFKKNKKDFLMLTIGKKLTNFTSLKIKTSIQQIIP